MSENDRFRNGTVRLKTGPRLHYVESGDGDGDPLVFLHGWPDSWFTWSRVLPLLPQHFRAIAIDQRGYGDSDRPARGYAIPDFGDDVVALIDALDIDSATIVGHSFGSFVARRVAIASPERVARLVLIGSGFGGTNPIILDLQKALRDLPDPVPPEFVREFQASTAYRPLPKEFFEQIIVESLKLPSRLWREIIDGLVEYDDAEELRTIAAPTLLLWGDKDALFPRAHQDHFLTAIPGAKLTVYKETGHCPNWEEPERVAADVAAFASE